jgi:hypothetical protein
MISAATQSLLGLQHFFIEQPTCKLHASVEDAEYVSQFKYV